MIGSLDQMINSAALLMAKSAFDAMDQENLLSSDKEGKEFLVLYNKKGVLQNWVTVGAVISVALALFSVISAPIAVVALGGFLWARHSISENIDRMIDEKLESPVASLSNTLKDKIEELVSEIDSSLPPNWKPQNSKIFGVPLFRSEIPWSVILPKTGKEGEKETSDNEVKV
jgi:hypothetical protein